VWEGPEVEAVTGERSLELLHLTAGLAGAPSIARQRSSGDVVCADVVPRANPSEKNVCAE
jgi:hypothetical protein